MTTMEKLPKSLWRIENDTVYQYDLFSMTPNPNYAVYFHRGTTSPIEVNIHTWIADGFYDNPLEAYTTLKEKLQQRLEYIEAIIDELEGTSDDVDELNTRL